MTQFHSHTSRRRFLKYAGLSALAVGAGVGGYVVWNKDKPFNPTTGPDTPFAIKEATLDQLEKISTTAPANTLEPQAFFTTSGRSGWRVQLPGYHPLATPAVSDGKVYVGGGFGSHEFFAFDARTGELDWQIRTGDDGPTAAVVFDDLVCFNTESCTLYICDRHTGRTLWERWLGDPLMNQPAVSRVGERDLVFMAYPGHGGHRLIALDLHSGADVWDVPIDADLISAPVVSDGVVYATAMSGMVYGFSAADGQSLEARPLNATSAPWIHEGQILVSQRDAGIAGAMPQEGVLSMRVGQPGERALGLKLEAEYLLPDAESRNSQAFAAYDEMVGFGEAPAAAQLSKAYANLGAHARTVIGGWSYQGARPLVAGDTVYSVLGNTFQGVDTHTQQPLWAVRFATDSDSGADRAFVPPAFAGRKLYAASVAGQLLALSAKDGQLDWGVELGEALLFQPAVAEGGVFLTTQSGKLYRFDAQDPEADGWLMWGGGPAHNGPVAQES